MTLLLVTLIFTTLALAGLSSGISRPAVFTAVSIPSHGFGNEHIVIIDSAHPASSQVSQVLLRLSLTPTHPDVRHVYNNSAFSGFAASMDSHCLDLLANMTDISLVEPAVFISSAASLRRRQTTYQARANAPWGLQRVSSVDQFGGNPGALDFTYSYATPSLGSGADIYVLDTGIYTQHNVFGGRAVMAWSYDGNMTDLDGHGTHVSGTAAGDILGIASDANVFGIKVLAADGGGWSSNVVAGIDYAVQRHDSRKANDTGMALETALPLNVANGKTGFLGSVMSLSLASKSPVTAIDSAVSAAVQAGIHTCVAAGNTASDACQSSPAASGGTAGPAITIGSIGMTAEISTFSNTGTCVDLFAPGENVISAWIGGPNMVNSISGTSMATPHVTGIVAYAMAGNATLAANTGLMKQWISTSALQLGENVLLANNGVQANIGQGMLGFTKGASQPTAVVVGAPASQTP